MGAILVALGEARDHDGRKWAICGALGGITRRCGWTRDDCAALIRAWLPAGDAAVDVDAGVTWACGAWTRPATEVTGAGALRESLGREAADVVIATCTALARPQGAGDRACALEGTPAVEGDASAIPGVGRLVDRTQPPRPLQFVVVGLELAVGKVSVLQAYANVAKTPFALLLAICVASGKPFLGFQVAQCRTLYLAFEGGPILEEREARLCAGLGLKREHVPLDVVVDCETLSDAFIDGLSTYCRDQGVGLIVADTYTSALPEGIDHNSSTFSYWLRQLGRMAEAINAVVLVLMHENKGDRQDGMRGISGHNTAAGAMQAAIRLTRKGDDRNEIDVECTREVRHAFAPFAVRFTDVPCDGAPTGSSLVVSKVDRTTRQGGSRACNELRVIAARRQASQAGLRIWRHMKGQEYVRHHDRSDLTAAAGDTSRRAVAEALARLEEAGLVESLGGRRGLTDAGRAAGEAAVASALAAEPVAGFVRG
jgi:DNA-binding transcriptional ArsR family regulator